MKTLTKKAAAKAALVLRTLSAEEVKAIFYSRLPAGFMPKVDPKESEALVSYRGSELPSNFSLNDKFTTDETANVYYEEGEFYVVGKDNVAYKYHQGQWKTLKKATRK